MNKSVQITSPFLTVEQVADRYNVSTDSIWRWKREGKFPKPVRIGGNCTRWRLEALIEHESNFVACCIGRLNYMSAA